MQQIELEKVAEGISNPTDDSDDILATHPIIFLMMFFNYLDRINLGFAGLQMNKDLGFSPDCFRIRSKHFLFRLHDSPDT